MQLGGFSPDMQPQPKSAMSDLRGTAKSWLIEHFTGPDQQGGLRVNAFRAEDVFVLQVPETTKKLVIILFLTAQAIKVI